MNQLKGKIINSSHHPRNRLSDASRSTSDFRVLLLLLLSLFSESIGSTLEFDSTRIDSSIPKNVTLLQYDFPGGNDIEMSALTLDGQRNEYVFVGGKNQLYRLQLNKRPRQPSDNPATTVPINADEVGFFSAEHLEFGPFEEEKICQPIDRPKNWRPQPEDNIIRTMFPIDERVFVCGTARCGICAVFSTDLSTVYEYVSKDSSDPVNVVATRKSSYAFLSHPRDSSRRTLYVASAYDDRDQDKLKQNAVPFLSSRNLGHSSFRYKFDGVNSKPYLRLHPRYISTYHEQFLYGFAHNGFAYILFTQVHSGLIKETRLGRVCEDDPRYSSYHEVPLQCQNSMIATTASLSTWLPKDSSGRSKQIDGTHLYVAFEQDGIHRSGVVCSFELAALEKFYKDSVIDCNTRANHTKRLRKFDDKRQSCKRIEQEAHMCGKNGNKWIEEQNPFQGRPVFKLVNGQH